MTGETIEINHSKNLLQISRRINSIIILVKSNNPNKSSMNNSNNSSKIHSNNNSSIKSSNSNMLIIVIDSIRFSKVINNLITNEMQRQVTTNKRKQGIIHKISITTNNLLIQLPIRALKLDKQTKIIIKIALLQVSLTILLLKLATSSMRIPMLRRSITTTLLSHNRRRKTNNPRVRESLRIIIKMVISRNNHPKTTITTTIIPKRLKYSSLRSHLMKQQ